MGRYRFLWSCWMMLAVTLGTAIALFGLPLHQALSLVVVVATVGFVCAMMVGAALHAPRATGGVTRSVARALMVGLLSGVCALGTAGLWMLLGSLSLVVVFLSAALSPWALASALRRRSRLQVDREPPTPAVSQAPDRAGARQTDDLLRSRPWMCAPTRSMPDDALCLAWRTTYAALEQQLSLSARIQVVQRRQELLDELERRNAQGFSAWLESGARAAGNPSRFLRSDDRPQHDCGW